MAVKKRGKRYYLRFSPFGREEVEIATVAKSDAQARGVEYMIRVACRSGDYRGLDSVARATCVRLFQNKGWKIPPDLHPDATHPEDELTLWRAVELFGKDPEIKGCKELWRYEIALFHVVDYFGKDKLLKDIWVTGLKAYQVERRTQGAAPATVNRELSSLSKLFGVMIEMKLVDTSPVALVKRLSTKSSEREVYISHSDVQLIAGHCPAWFQDLIWMAYYTGMRRGEITNLRRHQVNLTKRIITLSPVETKEGAWKRVPLRRELVPLLENAMRIQSPASDLLFLVRDGKGVRPAGRDTLKNPWRRAIEAMPPEVLKRWRAKPVYHDLRATWRTNARRSGMREDLEKEIMGHETRCKTVHERYGRISDKELMDAIDGMTFDNGDTEILVAGTLTTPGGTGAKSGQPAPQNKKRTAGGKPKSLISLVGGRGFEPPTPAV